MVSRSSRRVSLLALTLLAAALVPLGCVGESLPLDEVSEVQQTLATEALVVVSGSKLWQRGAIGPGTGNDWSSGGDAYSVTSMASFNGSLYVTAGTALWKRGAIGPGTGNDWSYAGDAYGVTAMASFNGSLYVTSGNTLWKRGAIGPGTGNDWSDVGEANGVTAMASFNGSLYVVAGNALWKRGAIGPGTGNDWSYAGDAFNVTAMASFNGSLYVTSNNKLWKRGAIGPGTGSAWSDSGEATSVVAMTSNTPWSPDPFQISVTKFAPRLRFDGSAHGYPTSAQAFYNADVVNHQTARIDNNDASTVGTGTLPTYYQEIGCGNQLRIKYWWFYGYQASCDEFDNGTHNGDWENVIVTLSEDRSSIAAVTFSMHGHTYTRLATGGGFEVEDATHPVVYVGKNSHAAHYTQGGSGVADNCLPWEEYRNNTSGLHLDTWSYLLSLDVGTEPWMVADRVDTFVWGPNGTDGVGTHPTRSGPSCSMNAADWTTNVPTWWHSQCKTGDRDDGTSCHTQCRPGYTDMGLTCTNWSITSLDTYSQYVYGYDYTLPTSNLGLLTNDYH